MRKIFGAAAGLMLAAAMWAAVPAQAADSGWLCDGWGGCAQSYSNWGGLEVFDEDCDGQGVYSNYRRDSGGNQVLNNYTGCGNSVVSGTDGGNPIFRFEACTNNPGPDHCSGFITRP